MAAVRFSVLKSLCNAIGPSFKLQSIRSYKSCANHTRHTDFYHLRSTYGYCNYHQGEFHSPRNIANAYVQVLGYQSPFSSKCSKTKPVTSYSSSSSILRSQNTMLVMLTSSTFGQPSHALSFSTKADKPGDLHVPGASSSSEADVSNSGLAGTDLLDKLKDAWQSAVDAVTYTGQKAKETSNELNPYVQQMLDTYPYLKNIVVPVTFTLTCTMLVWVVMPRILRRFHKYAMRGRTSLLPGDQVPYEKSFWGSLEDPVRYLVTFIAFSQIGMMVAPTTLASQYIIPAWRGAVILSFVWFLYRWKTNVFYRASASQNLAGLDREKILTLDKVSSVGLFVIGLMALAEACGVAVQSILTVGGIGGVATAFAAKDVLGNVLTGLGMQFTKPFSLGDTIKAGSVEGQVVEMGFSTTVLLNAEKFPVLVPNSMFSSQVIVNKSRAQWRAMASKIPLHIDDMDKIPQISDEIKGMLKSNPKVFLGKEAPHCFLSRIEDSYAELTLGCNLQHMRKDELYTAQQDILLQSVQIIKKHGAKLGRTWQDTASP